MKKLLALLLALTMALAFTACGGGSTDSGSQDAGSNTDGGSGGSTATDGDVIKVGVVLPLTGGSARMGELQLAGIQYCTDYWNEQGGLQGLDTKIELVIADSTGNPEVGVTETERLINNENVVALLGPYNSAVGAAMVPIAERYGIPFITTNCTADNVLEGNLNYTFRTNQSNSDNAITYAAFIDAVNSLGVADPIEKVAIIYENTDWGVGSNESFGDALREFGYEVTISESFETGSADFSAIVNRIKNSDVDAIAPMMYVNDSQLFTQQLAEYEVNLPLIAGGGGVVVDDYIDTLGEYSNYVFTINGWSIDTLESKPALAQEMNERCIAELGGEMNENLANGWLGAATMYQAIETAGSFDGDAIAAALAATDFDSDNIALLFHPYPGVRFDDVRTMTNQNVYANAIITQIVDGRYVMVFDGTDLVDGLVYPQPTFAERGL